MHQESYLPQTPYIKNIVRSIWQIEGVTTFQNETILPKGIIEIIFNFSEDNSIIGIVNSQSFQLPRCFLSGINTHSIQLQLPQHQTFLGIQFNPVAIKYLLEVPCCEFTDQTIDLNLLNLSFNSLWHKLVEKKTFNERVALLIAWLESRSIHFSQREILLNSILEPNGQHILPVPEIARTLCYSARHLSRKIYELTKMNTEQILLYKKYLHSLYEIHYSDNSLTEISYNSNFADQSHFVKVFKSFTSLTPGNYKKIKSSMPGHIYQNVR